MKRCIVKKKQKNIEDKINLLLQYYFPIKRFPIIYMNTKHEWMRSVTPPTVLYRGMHVVGLAVALMCIRWDLRALVLLGFWANLMCREKRSSNTWDCHQVTAWVMQPWYSVQSLLSPLNETGRADSDTGSLRPIWCLLWGCAVTIVMWNRYCVLVANG